MHFNGKYVLCYVILGNIYLALVMVLQNMYVSVVGLSGCCKLTVQTIF